MLKTQKILFAIIAVMLVSGCSSTHVNNNNVQNVSGFNMSKARILNRPTEYQIKERREFTTTATFAKVLGLFKVEGKNVTIHAPLLGKFSFKGGKASPAEAMAVKDILAKDPKADGAIILQSIMKEESFLFFFKRQIATVKARTFSLEPLGPISRDEARVLRLYK